MGPIFGYGYDLAIFDNYMNKKYCKAYARLGFGYNTHELENHYDHKDQ